MAIKAVVEKLDDVPEALREHYKEAEGGYALDIPAESIREHPSAKELKNALEGEREKRRKAIEERDEYKKTADKMPEDFDPEEWERLKAHGDPSEDVQKKVAEAREREAKRHEKKIKELEEQVSDLSGKYTTTRTETALKDALNEINVAPNLRRAAERLWMPDAKLDDDGNIVTGDGTPLKDAIKDWSDTDEGKYFIAAPNNGGGGALGGNHPGGSSDNPWRKDSFNLTKQMELQNREPEKAKRLKAEAGAQ